MTIADHNPCYWRQGCQSFEPEPW